METEEESSLLRKETEWQTQAQSVSKQKLNLTKIKKQRKTLRPHKRDEWPEFSLSSTLLKLRAGEFFKSWDAGISGHLCLLIGLTPEKVNFLKSPWQEEIFMQGTRCPPKLGSCPP